MFSHKVAGFLFYDSGKYLTSNAVNVPYMAFTVAAYITVIRNGVSVLD